MATTLDIPAVPGVIHRLTRLLRADDVNLAALGELVASDMALAAALLQAVGSARLGLRSPPTDVHQAATYLGLREVAAITYEVALRAAFPSAPELEALWKRAARRATFMKQAAVQWRREAPRPYPEGAFAPPDPYVAHAAGLFEECGKAVLFRYAADHYRTMLRAAAKDADLLIIERVAFGVGHDELGARLCHSWGLAVEAVACVREHLGARELRAPPPGLPAPAAQGAGLLSALAWHALDDVSGQPAALAALAPHFGLDLSVLRALTREAAAAATQDAGG